MKRRKNAYSEKLLDPRWQKKRLEILSRDNFQCRCCGDEQQTLHVHHIRYIRGNDPWDYPDHLLITLCSCCHESEHAYAPQVGVSIDSMMFDRGVLGMDVASVQNIVGSFPADRDAINAWITYSSWVANFLNSGMEKEFSSRLDSLIDEFLSAQLGNARTQDAQA